MSDRVDTEALAAKLTEAEKETLWEAIERAFLDTTTFGKASEDNIEHTVEAILAARDARVRADAWDEGAIWAGAIRLGGVVSPDNPYRVGSGVGEGAA